MKRLLTFLLLTIIMQSAFAQDEVNELDRRNGFKNIKLGMVADSIQGIKFKKDIKFNEEFDAKVFEVDHPDYKKIGEVAIKSIEVKAYKNLVFDILIIVDKDTRVMKALESIYGKSDYDLKNETYFWKTNNLTLKFRAHSKSSLELQYFSFVVSKMMKADKEKKVEDIANDF